MPSWVEHLFDSTAAAYESKDAQQLGYTHLIAGAKANPVLANRLEARVRRDYPAHYRRIIQYLGEHPEDSANTRAKTRLFPMHN
jgi:hypothetical protein